jgi:hypothetical protein
MAEKKYEFGMTALGVNIPLFAGDSHSRNNPGLDNSLLTESNPS